MKTLKLLTIIGTRPEAIKTAPLVLELEHRRELECVVCLTNQHPELSAGVLCDFGVRADISISVPEGELSLAEHTAYLIKELGTCIQRVQPDLVMVQGDTASALAGAMAAFYAKVPILHLEAGLRTYDNLSPFPEEANRRMISALASVHFAPTENSAENLRREGVSGDVVVTGNTAVDAMRLINAHTEFESEELRKIEEDKRIIVLTCHRRENYGKPMEDIFTAVKELAGEYNDLVFVFPVHPAPVVGKTAERILGGTENIKLVPPLSSGDMRLLLERSYFIMTDSGGLQEEAPYLAKPVLLLRKNTERPEGIKINAVKPVGVKTEDILCAARSLLDDPAAYSGMAQYRTPYGNGESSRIIAEYLINKYLG